MKIQDVKKKIIEVIKESTETEMTLTSETELFTDMGLSSVEVVVMLGDLEDALDLTCLKSMPAPSSHTFSDNGNVL